MQDLAEPNPRRTPVATPTQSYQPAKIEAVQEPPIPSSSTTSSNIDDLDDLMASLNETSKSRSSRRFSSKPSSQTLADEIETLDHTSTGNGSHSRSAYGSVSNGETSRPASVYAEPEYQPEPPKPAPVASRPVSQTPYQPTTQYQSNPLPVQNKPPPKVVAGDELDNLLSNLSDQMNNISVENPAARGTCQQCRKPILGEIVQAMGNTYHPEHFVCGNCHESLGNRNFFPHNNIPHCDRCFSELYCPKCAHCDKPVLDRCITALGKKWHSEHFICTQCLKPFGSGNFFERDGRPYCEADFYAVFAPKCASCSEPIRGDCINALGSQWHPEHFVCQYCQKAFVNGTFFEHGGKPYCEVHYHNQTGSLCSGCGKPITGRCVNALDKKWHPEHFVCAFCMNPLAGGSFTEHNNKAYCKECHGKLFGAA